MTPVAAMADVAVTGLLGIPFALLGAAFLAFGAHYQSRGVHRVERAVGHSAASGVSIPHLKRLFTRPSWIIGTLLLGLATVLQLVALGLSPIIVVQPLGVVALIITAMVNAKYSRISFNWVATAAVAMSVIGVGVFVTVATLYASSRTVTDTKLQSVVLVFVIAFFALLLMFAFVRRTPNPIYYIFAAGILYGFVATLAKVVISRFQQGEVDLITWVSIVALGAGVLLGMFFVHTAYASGPPDLVIAGLTVIDPLVAVLVGVIILGEAQHATLTAQLVFIVAGAVATVGVVILAKYHPQSQSQQRVEPPHA